jgi:putative ABC transport system permease protein
MLLDLKVAARALRARPLFTLVAVATLAVGIGSNAAIFSVVDAVLLRPLPFPQSDRLVALYSRYLPASGYDFPYFALSGPEFDDLRSRVGAFSAVAAYETGFQNLTLPEGEPERILTMAVTAEFFDVLGVRPRQGRAFTRAEAQRGDTCVAVFSHELASRSVPGGPGAVGSTIRLDDRPCAVVGVMPEGFAFLDERVRIWTGLSIDPDDTPSNRASHPLLAIARLRDGVTPQQTAAQLEALRSHWSAAYPDHYAKGHFAVTTPLHEDLVGDQRRALWLLGGAVLFVMLIVCVNLAALFVSRGEARRREFAVRHALGANRRRLVGQLLVEAMLLSSVGGVVGVLLANWLLAALLALYPQQLPVWHTIAVDHVGIAFSLLLVVVAGFVVGAVPAWNATGMRLQEALKADARAATATRRGVAARSALVVAQLALSIVLLAGAILLMRSYRHLQRVDLGFDPDRLLTFTLSIPEGRQPDAAAARRMLAGVEDRLVAMADAESAGAISNLPVASAGPPDDFVIEGRPAPAAGTPGWNARYIMATPGTFRALRIPLKRGRLLSETDVADQPLVAVLNETAARLYWPGDDPVGRTIRYFPQETSPSIRIVGIVGDVRSMGPTRPPPAAVYVPYAQSPRSAYEGRSMTFVVRSRGNPAGLAAPSRAAVASVDPSLPLANVRPMSEVVAIATGQPRFTTLVMTFFAGVAFFLAGLGLYGILAFRVEQRVREIGVRMALGAGRREIFRLIIGSGLGLVALGMLIGVPAAFALTRVLRGLLSGVTTTDPLTYGAVIALLTLSALLASYLPARRATRVDPIAALRGE